jgi:EAL domain-containing protein (putative c-di-GMP-specific phosphodiesterase class I)/signal transduction histidine kinase/DNA-binding NarL/FixJ family response regulator
LARTALTSGVKRTIRFRLAVLVLVSVGVTVALMTAVAAWRESRRDAALQSDRLHATAAVLASTAARATAERDRPQAFLAIRAITLYPDVLYARIEGTDGRLLTETGAASRLSSDASTIRHKGSGVVGMVRSHTVETSAPIIYGRTRVGRVVLVARATGAGDRVMAALVTSLAAGLLAALAGLAAAWRLQRRLTRPLGDLSEAMAKVQRSHDYSGSAKVWDDDEVGDLVRGFNRMLEEIRRRDDRIAGHVAGLEQAVAERTADLETARDAAESANRAKSDFLATMSHEIRTPMNGVMVMAELLAAGELPPRLRRFAEVIAKSGSSLLAIINDILDFSKIEAGKLELERAPVDMSDVVEDVLSLFWERAASKGLDLSAFIDPATPTLIAADETRLRQIIGNLVNNAIKFTETGGVLVHVAPDRDQLKITVHDTGIGIAQDKLKDVFGAFSQADQSTTRKFGGTGLGLSIARRLVEAMSGRMALASELGKGSSFAFLIPVEALQPAEPWPAVTKAMRVATGLGGRCTSWAIAEYLSRAGAEVVALDAGGDDLALSVVDPDHLSQAPRAPILCISEYADVLSARQNGEARPDAALVQPFRRRELKAVLEQLISGGPLASAVPGSSREGGEALPQFEGRRALVADDSPVNREVAAEALARLGVRCVQVEDGRAAVEAAMAEAFDIVLMDGSMPEMDGYEATMALRAAQAAAGRSRTPVVALTAHVVGVAAGAWKDAGMDGVLHKPFTLSALARTLGQFIEPSGATAANDTPIETEAPAGDMLLDPRVGADMAAMDDKGGFVARIRGLYRQHAPDSANRVRAAIAAGNPEEAARAAHALKSMSLNMGAARVAKLSSEIERDGRAGQVSPEAAAALDEALAATLQALGGAPEPAAAPSKAGVSDRDMARMLTHALRADEFALAYQPQFDREGASIIGLEALIRWKPKDGDPIPPDVFIPAAERNGLISDITEWVVARAVSETACLGDLPVAVNASAAEFGSDRFFQLVTRVLETSGFDPRRLEIEITETAIIEDETQVRGAMDRLRELGVRVSLDDFGAGYSSLSHLLRFPFDKLKIDKSFIDTCTGSVRTAAVVHGVVGIGRALGMKVVAEGVETVDQQKFLRAAGVHAMQGYLFQRPAPIAAIINLVDEMKLAS